MPLGKLLAACAGTGPRPSDIRIELVETKGAPPPPAPPLRVRTDDPERLREWLEELERRRRAWHERCEQLEESEKGFVALLNRIAAGPRGRRGGPQDWCCGGGEPAAESAPADGVTVDELKKAYRTYKRAVAAVDCAGTAVKAAWAEMMGHLDLRGEELRALLQRCDCDCRGERPAEARPPAAQDTAAEEARIEAIVARYVDARLAQSRSAAPGPTADPAAGGTQPPSGRGKPQAAG